jgi:hypothetical protein
VATVVRSVEPDREQRIVRQNATSTAARLVAIVLAGKNADMEEALALCKVASQTIYGWNMNGYDTKTPEIPQELY